MTQERINKYTESNQINVFSKGVWSSKRGANPFPIVPARDGVVLLAYTELPLTVEIQQAKREEEERIVAEALKIERLAEEKRRVKWAAMQKGDFFRQFIDSVESHFTPEQNDNLYHELSKELLDYQISNYTTPSDFVAAWSWALGNTDNATNAIYRGIKKAASSTFFDEDYALNPEKDAFLRTWLFERKMDFYYAVLKAGVEFVRDTFDIQVQPILFDEQVVDEQDFVDEDQPPVLDAVVETTSQTIYTLFSRLLATMAWFIPNIFSWIKPSSDRENASPVIERSVIVEDNVVDGERVEPVIEKDVRVESGAQSNSATVLDWLCSRVPSTSSAYSNRFFTWLSSSASGSKPNHEATKSADDQQPPTVNSF